MIEEAWPDVLQIQYHVMFFPACDKIRLERVT